MSMRIFAYLILVYIPVSTIASQSEPKAKNVAAEAQQQSAALTDDRQLAISNPFYITYRNQWYVALDVVEQRSVLRVALPAQIVSGIPFAAASSEIRDIELRTGAEVRYGITDRISGFVAGTYLADRDTSTTSSGLFSSSSSSYPRTGLMNPHFGIYGRLLGTQRDEWYIDVVGVYTPGIRSGDKSQVASPLSALEAGLAAGRNMGGFTAGLGTAISYSPETNYNNYLYRATSAITVEAITQYDFGIVFLNLHAGLHKYVDSVSNSDALNGKIRVIVNLEAGTKIGSNAFARISYGWLLPVSADYSSSGLNFVVEDKGGPAARLTVGARF